MMAASQARSIHKAHPPPSPRAGKAKEGADGGRLRLFALQATTELGKGIAEALGQPLAAHEERDFEDGEHKGRPWENVRDTDVYVVQSLHSGPTQTANDKICPPPFLISALTATGAA